VRGQSRSSYHITHTYTLGGDGSWDYLVPDPPTVYTLGVSVNAFIENHKENFGFDTGVFDRILLMD
jgi:predicted RNase H-like HicB family nuclease